MKVPRSVPWSVPGLVPGRLSYSLLVADNCAMVNLFIFLKFSTILKHSNIQNISCVKYSRWWTAYLFLSEWTVMHVCTYESFLLLFSSSKHLFSAILPCFMSCETVEQWTRHLYSCKSCVDSIICCLLCISFSLFVYGMIQVSLVFPVYLDLLIYIVYTLRVRKVLSVVQDIWNNFILCMNLKSISICFAAFCT